MSSIEIHAWSRFCVGPALIYCRRLHHAAAANTCSTASFSHSSSEPLWAFMWLLIALTQQVHFFFSLIFLAGAIHSSFSCPLFFPLLLSFSHSFHPSLSLVHSIFLSFGLRLMAMPLPPSFPFFSSCVLSERLKLTLWHHSGASEAAKAVWASKLLQFCSLGGLLSINPAPEITAPYQDV